jgi:hypothetical protein
MWAEKFASLLFGLTQGNHMTAGVATRQRKCFKQSGKHFEMGIRGWRQAEPTATCKPH